MATLNTENLIQDWQETVGLRVMCVDSFTLNDYDDPPTFTVITYDNGKVAVQRDQPYFTTSCGLIDATEAEKFRAFIESALQTQPTSEITPGNKYQFHELERWLNDWDNRDKALIVTHRIPGIIPAGTGFEGTAIMHTFGGNFCGDWLSGDGVLFYNDTEVHSAEPDQEFTVLQIIQY